MKSRRPLMYAAAGALLSLGELVGLLVVRELSERRPIAVELASDPVTYAYVLVTTAIVLACLGYALGRQADRLEALSETDALTGLPNRRALTRRLADELRRAERYGTPVSLLLLDVDRLKLVNDAHGHVAGDRLLREVAGAIAGTLRQSDMGARWGGDEFAVVVPNASADAARQTAERVAAQLAGRAGDEAGGHSTVSIGIATFDPSRDDRTDADRLIRMADRALYSAKAGGRNCIRAA